MKSNDVIGYINSHFNIQLDKIYFLWSYRVMIYFNCQHVGPSDYYVVYYFWDKLRSDICPWSVNSSRPCGVILPHGSWSTLDDFLTKTSFEPMAAGYTLHHQEHILMKFCFIHNNFHMKKCIPKWHLQNVCHFIHVSICYCMYRVTKIGHEWWRQSDEQPW